MSGNAISETVLQIEIDNRNWSDVVIYILHDGRKTRFGEVTAASAVSKDIPIELVSADGTVQLLVHRIGGKESAAAHTTSNASSAADLQADNYLSPVVSIRTGRTLVLELESVLSRSTLSVW
jgi:hypothetical protein